MKTTSFILLFSSLIIISYYKNLQTTSEWSYSIIRLEPMKYQLNIYKGKSHFQKLEFESMFTIDESWLLFEDWNNDGYSDLYIPREGGSGGQMYNIWLYQKDRDKFTKHEELSSLVSPSIDSTTHKICAFWRGGWAMEQRDTFEFVNNALVPIKSVHISRWHSELPNEGVLWEKREEHYSDRVIKIDSFIMSSWPDSIKDESGEIFYNWGERKK